MTGRTEIILAVYTIFYILILIYDICTIYIHKRRNIKHELAKKKLTSYILNKEQKKLYKSLKNSNNLVVLNDILDDEIPKINKLIKNNNYTEFFLKLLRFYSRKSSEDRALLCNILSYTSIEPIRIKSFLIKNIFSKSIYCCENTLNYIYIKKDIPLIKNIFELMSNSSINYNCRLLSDGLTKFTGNNKDLFQELYNNFSNYNDNIKIGIIKYFTRLKMNRTKEIYNLFNKETSKEVIINIIRYYTNHKYPKIYNIFIERLNNNYYHDSDYDIVMIQTLKNTKITKKLKNILINKLEDNNYYVRINSAKVLKKLNLLEEVTTTDKYANDIIEYLKENKDE